MAVLLDANVLIALLADDHVHHDAAETWFAELRDKFATCPITQGSLARMMMRQGESADTVLRVIAALEADSRHEFWPDEVSYSAVDFHGVIGHRQVTDSYLAQLARANGGRLATFDQGLAKLHDDVADLVATAPPA